ncbi:MAG TPA: DUF4253 domain-containing protein [Cyclobacteriaceae bacterium]|jgi:hypothetical protein|nr:DUF4253 domain-containing protein [Cyclobacteriaceae bacterium]
MKQLTLLLLIVVMAAGCSSRRNSEVYILTVKERGICDSLQIDSTIIQAIRSVYSNEFEPFHYSLGKTIEKDKEIESDPILLKGLVLKEKNSKSYDLVFALKDELRKMGYSIFLLENNFNINDKLDHIGVLKTTDKYSVLKQIRTDGINFDITNDSLITIIKKFDENYSLELIGASGDWCEFVIQKEPSNWTEFANEVYKVCPDVVDQGTGTKEALAEEMKRTKRLYFWWD